MWNPFRSKLAAGIVGGVENIYMQPGSKVLYLGAASGTTVSHVADLVGPVSANLNLSAALLTPYFLKLLKFIMLNRKAQFMLSSSPSVVVVTLSIWPRSALM